MIFDHYFVWGALSIFIGLVGYALYFRSIFRGGTKPHIFTWGIYTLNDTTVFLAQVLKGAGPGSWALLLSVLENLVVVALALRWRERHIRNIDWFCLVASLVGIALWWLTSDPLTAVVIASGINVLGLIPTFKKAYEKPHEESITVWGFDIFRFSASLCAIVAFNLTTALFPAVIVACNALLVAMILFRRWQS